jgi:hypothetical protein
MSSTGVALSRRALVSGALVMLIVGFATKTLFFRDIANTKPAGRASSVVTEAPRLDASGVPVGFARSQAGARDAAIAYVQMGDLVLSLDPSTAANVLRRVASREGSVQFVQSELAGFTRLRDALGRGSGPIRLRVGVIATRVDAFLQDRAEVRLWRVAILSRDGMSNPGEQWATVTYDLVWEQGNWKIWSETDVPGPDPAASSSQLATPSELEAALAGFEPVGMP